jgi:hypothetical protein
VSVLKRLVERLCRVLEQPGPACPALLSSLRALAAELARPPTVAVAGEVSAGKSTLINLLLGQDRLPTGPLPTTALPLRLHHHPHPRLLVRHADGRCDSLSPGDLRRVVAREPGVTADPRLASAEAVELGLPVPFLQQACLLDTPGLNGPGGDDERTLKALGEADAVIWCAGAVSGWTGSSALSWRKLPRRPGRMALLVLTRADNLNRLRDRNKQLRHVRAATRGLFGRVEITSLAEAQEARPDGRVVQESLWERSGFGGVEEAVSELLSPSPGEAQIRRAFARALARWPGGAGPV